MAHSMLAAVEALEFPTSTGTPTEEPLIIKAPDATCGYIDGRKGKYIHACAFPLDAYFSAKLMLTTCHSSDITDQAYTCGDIRQTCALYFPTSAYARHQDIAPQASPPSFEPAVTLATGTIAVDALHTRKRRHLPSAESAPPTTQAPDRHPGRYGTVACCDKTLPECTLQPTACVDSHLHPASILCTGNCPNDDMTLKCTADMNWQCKLAQIATPITYLEKPRRVHDKLHRREETGPRRLATLDHAVRGWYCGQLESNTDILSQSLEVSTLGQIHSITDSVATEASDFDEMVPNETHSATYTVEIQSDSNCSNETHPPGSQPTPCADNPSLPDDSSSVDAEQGQAESPSSEDCEWIDDYGNCCDPSEGVYYRPRRQRQVRRSGVDGDDEQNKSTTATPVGHDRDEEEQSSTTDISAVQVITYTHLTTIASRPMATFTPVEAPNMSIIEAIYVVSNTYENQTETTPLREATRSYTILPYMDTLKISSTTARPTRSPRPIQPLTSKGGDPQAGMKAGIAIGAIVVLALVGFVIVYCRRLRQAKRMRSERDSQPGPTRGWST